MAAVGMIGTATTMLTRRAARKAMHRKGGEPRLPRAAREKRGFGTMLLLAVAAGVLLAVADVVLEQRKHALQKKE